MHTYQSKCCVNNRPRLAIACVWKHGLRALAMFLYLIGGEVSTVVQGSAKLKTQ